MMTNTGVAIQTVGILQALSTPNNFRHKLVPALAQILPLSDLFLPVEYLFQEALGCWHGAPANRLQHETIVPIYLPMYRLQRRSRPDIWSTRRILPRAVATHEQYRK